MNGTATSRALSEKMGSFAWQVSARTIPRRLQQHKSSVRWPWLRLSMTGWSAFNGVFNDEPGLINGLTSCFQTNLNFIYSIMMVASVFEASWKTEVASNIVILAHHLEWWYGVPLDIHLGHLLFAFSTLSVSNSIQGFVNPCGSTLYLSPTKCYVSAVLGRVICCWYCSKLPRCRRCPSAALACHFLINRKMSCE